MHNYIKGVGAIPYGVCAKQSHLLAYDVAYDALNDADLNMNDIDAVVVSNLEWFYSSERQRHMASLLAATLKTRVPIIRLPAACAGGGTAFWTANKLMKNDSNFNNILVIGVEKLMETTRNSEAVTEEFMMAMESRWEQLEGINVPCSAALIAQAYLKKFPDTTMDDLALISFKNHTNGFSNPLAFFYGKKISLEQIKNSPIAASPLRVFDCSIVCDGAAACVLSRDKTDIKLIGTDYCVDFIAPFERKDMVSWEINTITAKNALEQADLEPWDIDFVELHDAFTIIELMAYEDLGFAKKGEGAELIRNGIVNIDGKLPVNPSGGLKAKGHPVSATGLGMIYEIVNQMRGKCGDRQLSKTRTALAHKVGGIGNAVA